MRMKLKLRFLIAAVFVLAIFIPAVQAQAYLTFEGGNGAPLTITLQQTVTYTINNSNCSGGGPVFIFDGAGDPFQGLFLPVTGTITFFINGGTAQPITSAASGVTANNISPNDIFIFGAQTGAPNGSTIVLNAGTVMTTSNAAGPTPANGSYPTFITEGNGVQCSENGIATGVTAASVSISGRVLTNSRRGLNNALVYSTDREGNTRAAKTNSFGYYRFEDVQAGQTITLTVVSKRFQFAPKVLNLNEEIRELNFIGEP
ncbi:MAG TPA: carboxypeptidase-like regulatory domain-containing protein [Pyrinomonadaceae bacterium]